MVQRGIPLCVPFQCGIEGPTMKQGKALAAPVDSLLRENLVSLPSFFLMDEAFQLVQILPKFNSLLSVPS